MFSGWLMSDAKERIDNMVERFYFMRYIYHERHDSKVSDSSHRRSGSVMDVMSASGHHEARNHHVAKGQKGKIQ